MAESRPVRSDVKLLDDASAHPWGRGLSDAAICPSI